MQKFQHGPKNMTSRNFQLFMVPNVSLLNITNSMLNCHEDYIIFYQAILPKNQRIVDGLGGGGGGTRILYIVMIDC